MYFRADGNEQIATGHIMRCLSVADALRERGEQSTFILADESMESLVQSRGYKTIVLHSKWDDLEDEISLLLSEIEKQDIRCLVVDSYFVTEHYLQEIQKNTLLCYIDDLNRFVYPVDILINYGLMSKEMGYEERYAKKARNTTKFLLGGYYIPLRKEFWDISYQVRDEVKDILVTTGGTDSLNVAGQLLEEVQKETAFEGICFHVVLGCFHQRKQELYERFRNCPNIKFYENVSNISDVMKKCDIAVTAGGTTTFELCAVGIPSICLSIAANQKEGAKDWENKGIMLYAGDMEEAPKMCIQGVVQNIKRYMASLLLRQEKSNRMQEFTDGHGAEHIAEELIKYKEERKKKNAE